MGNTEEKIIVEVIGKTGKPVKKNLFDINLSYKVKQNEKTGKFEPYISRWYRLEGEFDDPRDALIEIMRFNDKYNKA